MWGSKRTLGSTWPIMKPVLGRKSAPIEEAVQLLSGRNTRPSPWWRKGAFMEEGAGCDLAGLRRTPGAGRPQNHWNVGLLPGGKSRSVMRGGVTYPRATPPPHTHTHFPLWSWNLQTSLAEICFCTIQIFAPGVFSLDCLLRDGPGWRWVNFKVTFFQRRPSPTRGLLLPWLQLGWHLTDV